MTKQLNEAGSGENCTRTEEAKRGASEGSREPIVVLVMSYVVNGSRGEADSASDQGARDHPSLWIGQIRPPEVDNSADVCATEFLQLGDTDILPIKGPELEDGWAYGLDASADRFSAPQRNQDSGARFQLLHTFPAVVPTRE